MDEGYRLIPPDSELQTKDEYRNRIREALHQEGVSVGSCRAVQGKVGTVYETLWYIRFRIKSTIEGQAFNIVLDLIPYRIEFRPCPTAEDEHLRASCIPFQWQIQLMEISWSCAENVRCAWKPANRNHYLLPFKQIEEPEKPLSWESAIDLLFDTLNGITERIEGLFNKDRFDPDKLSEVLSKNLMPTSDFIEECQGDRIGEKGRMHKVKDGYADESIIDVDSNSGNFHPSKDIFK